jgi:di/tricarboxylate transporter
MSLSAILTLTVLFFILASLYFEVLGAAFTFVVGVVVLGLLKVLTVEEMLAGFSNEPMLLVIMLLLVGEVIRKTGVINGFFERMMNRAKTTRGFIFKVITPMAGISAFLNNTPLVAIMIPFVQTWTRKMRVPASKLMIPLSFGIILGGNITLIGTSNNLILSSLIHEQKIIPGFDSVGFFDFAWVGLPMLIIGMIYLWIFSDKLLPSREEALDRFASHEREYMVEAVVQPGSSLVGSSIPNSGLLNLKGLSLMEVRTKVEEVEKKVEKVEKVEEVESAFARDSSKDATPQRSFSSGSQTFSTFSTSSTSAQKTFSTFSTSSTFPQKTSSTSPRRIPSTSPDYRLSAGDRLLFTGATNSVTELIDAYPGIDLVDTETFAEKEQLEVLEVVVSHNSPLVGKSVREIRFRNRYGAVVLGVHRNGEKLMEKTADIRLRPGDVILLLAENGFRIRSEETTDFYHLQQVRQIQKPGPVKSALVLGGLVVVIVLSVLGVIKLIMGTAVYLMILLLTKIANPKEVFKSLDYNLGLIVVMTLALGTAMYKTGLAGQFAWGMINLLKPFGLIGIMTGLYLTTALISAYINNKAALTLIFPIALLTASNLNLNPLPFALLIAVASMGVFITPHGYQTNLMVYGPGGYRFRDFLPIGLPLSVLNMIVAVGVLWVVFFG